ncbi:MAG: HNH endonuclease, partial [Candidatus Electrothrix sp. AX5]|nr:HNH endonuclease [Candidatus Electrothrix sp. AX5]
NYLFSVISKEGAHTAELKTLEERWEAIIGLLGRDSFPEFFRVFWNSGHKLVRKTNLFKIIRQAVSDRGQAFALIRDLDRHARIYAALRNPLDKSWERDEQNSLQQLQMFNVRQPLSLLLAAFDSFGDTDRNSFKQILRTLTMLSFRYNVICGLPGNELERVYNAIAVQLSAETPTSTRAVITALQPIYPDDKLFKAAFADKSLRTTNSRNKKVVRYILFELERSCSKTSYDPDNSAYTIEHILPEHPEEGWNAFDDRQHENTVYQLGNMTLLSASANRELGNAPYQRKKAAYAQSEFTIAQGISRRYDDWTPATIASRQTWMASQAVSIWNIPF